MKLEGRVVTTRDWLATHRPHLVEHYLRTSGSGPIVFPRVAHSHPSGTWFSRVCPCGAKHLSTGDEDET